MGVIVEPTEDVVYVTVASGWRIETWAVFDHGRELVSVIDAGPPLLSQGAGTV